MKKAAQGGFINATDLADYLVKKGLVVRTQNDQDRRAVIITISDKGRDIIKSAQARYNDITDEIFADISKEDEEAFVRVLKHTYSKLYRKK
jgi:DNA-binding MarR family transcriptional regulator